MSRANTKHQTPNANQGPRQGGVPVLGSRFTFLARRSAAKAGHAEAAGRTRNTHDVLPSRFTFYVLCRAFTLIEVLISGALMTLILASGYFCFSAAMSSRRVIEPRAEVLQNARVAMALMTADLRNACSLSKDIDFLGMHRMLGQTNADNLDFATHNYTPHGPNEGDFCQESFFLNPDPETGQLGLWRRRNPRIAPNPLSGGNREQIARGVAGLRFEYFDGFDWYDTWGDTEGNGKAQTSNRQRSNLWGMPDAVRITLSLREYSRPAKKEAAKQSAPSQAPLVFQTVVRLSLAANLEHSETSDSGDSTDQTTPNQNSVSGANQ